MAVRIDQSAIELAILGNPNVRIDQSAIEYATAPVPPSITCGNPPDGSIGTPYSHFFPVSGGLAPYVFSIFVGSLPPGLTLNAATGEVSGIPTLSGRYTFTVQVVDSNLTSSTVQCSILIATGVRITLRGVKRRPCDPGEESGPEVVEVVQGLPGVKRAL